MCRSTGIEESTHEGKHIQGHSSPHLSSCANARPSESMRPKAMNPSLTSQEAQWALRVEDPPLVNNERAIKALPSYPKTAQKIGQVPCASSAMDTAVLKQSDEDIPEGPAHAHCSVIKKVASCYAYEGRKPL
jgi:hypothetical protein